MRSKVLLVDDEVNVLSGYERQLRAVKDKIEFYTADSGNSALEVLKEKGPFSVIISDYRMPGMNGLELLEIIGKEYPEIIKMMLTGQADFNAVINIINRGHVFRFLTKPCSPEDLLNAIMAGVNQYNLIHSEKLLLTNTLGGSIRMLVDMLSLAKPTTFAQSQRIRILVRDFLNNVNIENSWQLEIASMLVFIGCVTLPDALLCKVNSGKRLTPEENKIYMSHAVIASDLISKIPRLEEVSEIVKYQEKDYNGKGFPIDDICGENIPLGARVLRIFLDYNRFISQEFDKEEAIGRMEAFQISSGVYDAKMFSIVKLMILNDEDETDPLLASLPDKRGKALSSVKPAELEQGMILAEDIVSENGEIIASSGQELTAPMIVKINNYLENDLISGEVKFY